ncbi:replication initiator [Streptomyces sp. WMMC500]|uniref:replication initiator n=1 Tax=Streptomyces sp. WMMC500 TaxID=3015154 RepID=UPI0032B1921F
MAATPCPSLSTGGRPWLNAQAPRPTPRHSGSPPSSQRSPRPPSALSTPFRQPAVPLRHRHGEDAPEPGTPLDPYPYDYAGTVLWHNQRPYLRRYFTIHLRREIARRCRTHREGRAREQSRVTFGKVAEYQNRGAVHFHAVIRFDGPDGPDSRPANPGWPPTSAATSSTTAKPLARNYLPDRPGKSRRMTTGVRRPPDR